MKIIIVAFIGAIAILGTVSAQPTSCTESDRTELKNITTRVDECTSTSCRRSENETNCQCCVRIRDSDRSSRDEIACCRQFATGLDLYQQCKDSLNSTSGDNGNRTKRSNHSDAHIVDSWVPSIGCNFEFATEMTGSGGTPSGAEEIVHAVSAMSLLISIAVATSFTL